MLSLQLVLTYDIDLFAVAFWQFFFASTLQQSIYQFYLLGDCSKTRYRRTRRHAAYSIGGPPFIPNVLKIEINFHNVGL